jgi:Ca-activated chloride channel family protein
LVGRIRSATNEQSRVIRIGAEGRTAMSADKLGAGVASHRRWFGRATARRRWVIAVVGAVAVAAVVGGVAAAGLVATGEEARACTGAPTTVTVAADGHFPVLDELARRWTAEQPSVDGRCVGARVVRAGSSEVAAALGPTWDEQRDGPRPDVWAPDSVLWLRVAANRPDAAALLPGEAPSIASSPIVLALRRPMAEALGWPQQPIGWDEVLGTFATPGAWARVGHPEWASLTFGMSEPTVSTAGLGSMLALLDRDANMQLSDAELTAGLTFGHLLNTVAPSPAAFLDELRAARPGAEPAVATFPIVERDLAAYAAANPALPLVPIYPKPDTVVADFPYAVLAAGWVDDTRRAAAERFRQYLLDAEGRTALAAAGFRAPDRGIVDTAVLAPDRGFQRDLAAPRPMPPAAALSQLVTDWTGLQRRSNILAVLDVSGSMSQPVPGTPLTRLQLLKQTASAGFNLLTSRTSIGLWEFSNNLTPTTDYRELVPYGPMTTPVGGVARIQALLGAVDALQARGGTGLYNTTHAAVTAMQSHWQPNSTNAVLLITDGRNESADGLSRAELLARLAREARPDRPVAVIGIAVGPEADAEALMEISRVTGGRTFVARDAATAVQTLVLAFAGRLR